MTTAYGSVRTEHGIVSKMVLASAAGTGPIFPGAPAPPDVNVANPTLVPPAPGSDYAAQ